MDGFATSTRPARRRLRGPGAACAGLDIGGDRLRLATVRPRRGGLRLERLAEEALAPGVCEGGRVADFEALAQACRRLLRRQAADAGALVLALPATAALSMRFILPAASRDAQRLAQVCAGLAAHGLAPDTLALDYRVLGPAPASPADVRVLALCAPSLMAEDRLALAEALALPLRALPADGWCLAGFLRAHAGDAVLHLGASGAWLSRHAEECLALPWRAGAPDTSLLLALAPLLQARQRLLLTGDHRGLPGIAAALCKYGGIDAAVAGLPARLQLGDMLAAAVTPLELAPFHCALALAAAGFA